MNQGGPLSGQGNAPVNVDALKKTTDDAAQKTQQASQEALGGAQAAVDQGQHKGGGIMENMKAKVGNMFSTSGGNIEHGAQEAGKTAAAKAKELGDTLQGAQAQATGGGSAADKIHAAGGDAKNAAGNAAQSAGNAAQNMGADMKNAAGKV